MDEEVKDVLPVRARAGQVLAMAAGMGAIPMCSCGRGAVYRGKRCRQCLDEKPAFVVTTKECPNEAPREATGRKPEVLGGRSRPSDRARKMSPSHVAKVKANRQRRKAQ